MQRTNWPPKIHLAPKTWWQRVQVYIGLHTLWLLTLWVCRFDKTQVEYEQDLRYFCVWARTRMWRGEPFIL